jgi:hypothetical protein
MWGEGLQPVWPFQTVQWIVKQLPYATHITRLFKGYMTKTKLVRDPRDRKEWENILGWRTLTKG